MKKAVFFLFFAFVFASCGRFEGNDHRARIVCVSRSYNEALFEMGVQKDIVGIDASSSYPPEIKNITNVGYSRDLNAQAIIACKPTLIIHDKYFGDKELIKQLKSLKIPMKKFADSIHTIYDAELMIRELGAYFDRKWQADSLCNKLDADMAKATQNLKQYTDTPKVAVIHFDPSSNTYFIMTDKSIDANIVKLSGGLVPADTNKAIMIPYSAADVINAAPDVIFITSAGYDKIGSLDKVKDMLGIAQTKAGLNNRIYRVEDYDIAYLSVRTGENVIKFQKLIHTHTGQ